MASCGSAPKVAFLNMMDLHLPIFIHLEDDSTTISNSFADRFLIDKKGNYWVTTYRGFNKLNRKKGTFKRYIHDDNDVYSLCNNQTKGMNYD